MRSPTIAPPQVTVTANFPGVRYDFRDVLEKPGQRYTKPPVAIMGRPEWNGRPA